MSCTGSPLASKPVNWSSSHLFHFFSSSEKNLTAARAHRYWEIRSDVGAAKLKGEQKIWPGVDPICESFMPQASSAALVRH